MQTKTISLPPNGLLKSILTMLSIQWLCALWFIYINDAEYKNYINGFIFVMMGVCSFYAVKYSFQERATQIFRESCKLFIQDIEELKKQHKPEFLEDLYQDVNKRIEEVTNNAKELILKTIAEKDKEIENVRFQNDFLRDQVQCLQQQLDKKEAV